MMNANTHVSRLLASLLLALAALSAGCQSSRRESTEHVIWLVRHGRFALDLYGPDLGRNCGRFCPGSTSERARCNSFV